MGGILAQIRIVTPIQETLHSKILLYGYLGPIGASCKCGHEKYSFSGALNTIKVCRG